MDNATQENKMPLATKDSNHNSNTTSRIWEHGVVYIKADDGVWDITLAINLILSSMVSTEGNYKARLTSNLMLYVLCPQAYDAKNMCGEK